MVVYAFFALTDGVVPVFYVSDPTGTRIERHLRVASQACGRLARHQKLVVDGAMWIVARLAAVAHGIVLKDERALLLLVALEALLVLTQEHRSSRSANIFAVQVMAIRARHSSCKHWMAVLKLEFGLDIRMASEAGALDV